MSETYFIERSSPQKFLWVGFEGVYSLGMHFINHLFGETFQFKYCMDNFKLVFLLRFGRSVGPSCPKIRSSRYKFKMFSNIGVKGNDVIFEIFLP